jgi:hypothetical protein
VGANKGTGSSCQGEISKSGPPLVTEHLTSPSRLLVSTLDASKEPCGQEKDREKEGQRDKTKSMIGFPLCSQWIGMRDMPEEHPSRSTADGYRAVDSIFPLRLAEDSRVNCIEPVRITVPCSAFTKSHPHSSSPCPFLQSSRKQDHESTNGAIRVP